MRARCAPTVAERSSRFVTARRSVARSLRSSKTLGTEARSATTLARSPKRRRGLWSRGRTCEPPRATRGEPKALFDQQPVEACAMISACLDARRITNNPSWSRQARRVFRWFVGQNHLRLPLYDPSTGGCRDGLHEARINENQGAESTLSFLLSLLEIKLSERAISVAGMPARQPPAEVVAGVW
jgi:hypothetical protein